MFCSNCGNEVDDKAVICVRCGQKLSHNRNGAAQTSDIVLYLPLIFGIASLLFMWFGLVGIPCSVIAIIMAIVLRSKVGKQVASQHYFGAGIACAIIGIVLPILILVLSVLGIMLPFVFVDNFFTLAS